MESIGSGTGACACRGSGTITANILDALFDALFVLSVAEVDFEVIHCHARARGVKFPWAVVAADTREVLIFDFLAVRETVRVGHWGEGVGIDGGISHHAFKGVIWVGLFEFLETDCEPRGWWGLRVRHGVSQGPNTGVNIYSHQSYQVAGGSGHQQLRFVVVVVEREVGTVYRVGVPLLAGPQLGRNRFASRFSNRQAYLVAYAASRPTFQAPLHFLLGTAGVGMRPEVHMQPVQE